MNGSTATNSKRATERIPPHSIDAEQALLGAMLIDEGAIARGIETLRQSRAFYVPGHRKIFDAILGLYERSQPADITTVSEELGRSGDLDGCGGRTYIAGLASGVATAANAEYYARIVLEKATLRELIEASTDIIGQCYRQEKEVVDLLDEAEQKVFDISEHRLRSDFSTIKDLLPHTFEAIEEYKETLGGLAGHPTGFSDLDAITAGLHPSDLIIIAGRPSMGKSALALNIAENFSIESGKAVVIFSLEMSKEQLALRMVCGRARLSSHKIRTGKMPDSDWSKLTFAAGALYDAKIYIDDTAAMTVLEMRSKARRLASQVELGMIIVDYMQMMSGSRYAENRQQEISQISRGLKGLAKELKVPVIACSQLSRMVEQRGGKDKRPQLSDLRESGAIEQDADVVMFIYRQEYYRRVEESADRGPGGVPKEMDDDTAEIIIAKQRNGPTGTVKLAFLKEYARFESLAPGRAAPPGPSDASVPF